MALVVTPITDQVVKTADTTTLNLFSAFDDPRTTGLVARFELYNPALGGGVTNMVLFDQAGAGAPQTVQNFRKYVNDGDYTNTIIHRSVPGFVVQGGGFTVNGFTPANPSAAIGVIPTDPPIVNEFSPGRSNVRGTIAMAKLSGNPNSATSQWFFNLGNNAASLDNQNGGFTVFGQVMSTADLAPLDAIAALPRVNAQGAFSELPVQGVNPQSPVLTGDENFVRYRNITVSQMSELQFSVVRNTNPDLVTASIVNNQLVMSYRSAAAKTAEITIRATNLLGETTDDTFVVTLADSVPASPVPSPAPVPSPVPTSQPTEGNDRLLGTNANDVIAGQGGNDQINGGNGNDRLSGGAGSDRLAGDAGNDWLDGGTGNDRLATGKGQDVIVIGRGDGFDVVQDFADRRDKIKLEDGLSFGQLSVRQRGDDTLLQIGGTRVLLENVAATAIGRSDFR